ncbi:MAG TPA: copper chaperone PCu(A)C [Candidatus Corynebacterium gallistercoris]|uniref:Copper chaperone PCu(A)C n=1 Tax=Candidatus Corynebacterium gallistercoris TaxID=2838530 RepID=A0A9D1S0F0_9CORY|nr:copper chaperone PCu(A)C [Candidatus Corynebacterium gallistercoris]
MGAATVVTAALVLAGCSDASEDSAESSSATSSSAASETHGTTAQEDAAVTLDEGYVTAKPADKEMTSVMGHLVNHTDSDLHITAVSGDLDGAAWEIHETSDGTMRVKEDGLTIPAGGHVALEPGGDHIMIMNVPQELAAGDTVSMTLTDDGGNDYVIADIPVRVQQSSHEHYAG